MPFQESSIIDEHLGPCLHWRVHMVFTTRKSYFAHQSSSLEQHRFPRIPVNCSLSSYRGNSFLRWSQLLDLFQPRACACSSHMAVDFHLAHQSTVQTPSSSSGLLPDHCCPACPLLQVKQVQQASGHLLGFHGTYYHPETLHNLLPAWD